ncbi:zinc finger protein CKR1-like [Grus japonensis]|uniref:Zinc finger protein CKR1-like n=1 Tax=Grus japonensis TaxID=30415 RepID=A0ABC9XUU8_GRUJA
MSAKAKRLMNISMDILCKGVVTEADRRRRQRRGSFIGILELQAAVDKVIKGEDGAHFSSSIPSRSCMN